MERILEGNLNPGLWPPQHIIASGERHAILTPFWPSKWGKIAYFRRLCSPLAPHFSGDYAPRKTRTLAGMERASLPG